jgi:hypothetical protein
VRKVKNKRLKIRAMLLTPMLLALFFSFIPKTNANVAPCDTYQVNGGDQAFLMNLNTPLEWGGTVYTNNIYVSPKGTITFGVGDYTFWTFPPSPSISIGSWDYHAFANTPGAQWDPGWGVGKDLYVRYGSTATSICVDWKVMVWGQTSGEPVYIRMLAEVNPINYTWTPTYQVSSNAPGGARYGARYVQNGQVFPLSVQTITEPPAPSPTPSPTITPTPTPTPTETPTETPTPTPTPSETIEPTPEPTPTQTQDPDPVQPDPDPTPVETPVDEPIVEEQEEVQEEEEIILESSEEPTPIEEIISVEEEVNNAIDELIVNEEEITNEQLDDITELLLENYEVNEVMPVAELLDNLSDEQVLELLEQLDENQIIEYREGVELEAGVAVVFEQLADPAALLGEFVSDPGQVLEALGQLGADMTEEEREDSQSVVVATVIVGQLLGSVSMSSSIVQMNARAEIRRIT